jgi:hypothetical protein
MTKILLKANEGLTMKTKKGFSKKINQLEWPMKHPKASSQRDPRRFIYNITLNRCHTNC